MPKDESYVDAEALARLMKTFEAYGANRHDRIKEDQGDTNSAVVHTESATPAERDELRSAFVELADLMADSLNTLVRQAAHLDDAQHTGQREITETENSAAPEGDQPRPA